MNTIESLLDTLTNNDGYTQSCIPGVSFFKAIDAIPRAPMMYESRIIIVGRGEKIGYLNGKTLHYNADNYLILSLPMAFECETKADVLALVIDINLKLLAELISYFPMPTRPHGDTEEAVNAIPLRSDLKHSIIHLLEIAQSAEESRILGEGALKEILYRILKDQHGGALFALYEKDSKFARFAQLIHRINSDIAGNYSLETLSADMAMSETSLYRYFKKLTSQSPLQYIKHIRLQRAKEFIIKKELTLQEVSKKVGYKSMSQFSREYHTYFGISPKQTNHEEK